MDVMGDCSPLRKVGSTRTRAYVLVGLFPLYACLHPSIILVTSSIYAGLIRPPAITS